MNLAKALDKLKKEREAQTEKMQTILRKKKKNILKEKSEVKPTSCIQYLTEYQDRLSSSR